MPNNLENKVYQVLFPVSYTHLERAIYITMTMDNIHHINSLQGPHHLSCAATLNSSFLLTLITVTF